MKIPAKLYRFVPGKEAGHLEFVVVSDSFDRMSRLFSIIREFVTYISVEIVMLTAQL